MNNILFSDMNKIRTSGLNYVDPDVLTELVKTKDSLYLFDKIFNIAKKLLSADSEYGEYFKNYDQQIRYELYMKIYDILYLARKIASPIKSDYSKYIKLYSNITGISESTLGPDISKKHTSVIKHYENTKLFTNPSYLKRDNYLDYVYTPPSKEFIIEYSPIELDIIFNIHKSNSFIYNSKKCNYGIHIPNYHKLSTSFCQNHTDDKDTFEHDHSVYIFEKMHGMIGYQRCFYNYLETFAFDSIPSDEYFPLYEYTKLFDTTHPSLTDYLLQSHNVVLKTLYDYSNIDEHKELFVKIQLLNLWVLPLMSLIIENLLFSTFVEDYIRQFEINSSKPLNIFYSSAYDDFKIIEDKLKYYLQSKMHTYCSNSTYSKRLDEINEQISNYEYHFLSKKVIDSKTLKTESVVQIFNNLLSHCFYMKSLPQFITDTYCYQYGDCYKALYEYIHTTYDALKGTSFYTCNEYINHLANKK